MDTANGKKRVDALRLSSPRELIDFPTFVYHRGSVLGKGSYGKVYLGWLKSNWQEVAVKVIKAEFYEGDAKNRENLDREIRIQEALRDCENVVRLIDRREEADAIYLVMEKCDYDLQHHLHQCTAMPEQAIKDFLQQLGTGIEYMHKHDIVHRDLKPANILLVHNNEQNRLIVKIADFGFARHFRFGEGTKPVPMFSLAGTPVFMAPEALDCVFNPGRKHYGEKVDMWSVGAILYQCIVGRPAFYAQLQDILPILRKKGEAIAFKRGRTGQIVYIRDLPSEVDSRLSTRFKQQMNTLLRQMLQIQPEKRMSFTEFFQFISELHSTQLELFCPSNGTHHSLAATADMTCQALGEMIASATSIEPSDQIVVDMATGSTLDPCRDVPLPPNILQQTQRFTLLVLSKHQMETQSCPPPDEEYMQSLVKAVDDPNMAIALIQADGLSQMCSEVVETASETQQAVVKALLAYKQVVAGSHRTMEDTLKQVQLLRARFECTCKGLLDSAQADMDMLGNLSALHFTNQLDLHQAIDDMRKARQNLLGELREAELRCSQACSDMSREEEDEEFDKQLLVDPAHNLQRLVEEARLIRKLHGGPLISSTKALLDQCQQRQKAFLEKAHERLRSLYLYVQSTPTLQMRVKSLEEDAAVGETHLTMYRQSFRMALFPPLVKAAKTSPQNSLVHINAAPTSLSTQVHLPLATDSVPISQSSREEIQTLKDKLQKETSAKEAFEQQLNDLKTKMDNTSISVPAHSLFEVIGVPNVEQSHPSEVSSPAATLRPEERTVLPSASAAEEHTLFPATAGHQPLPVSSPGHQPLPASSPGHQPLPASSQFVMLPQNPVVSTIPPPFQPPPPGPQDKLDLAQLDACLSRLLAFTQHMLCCVNTQGADEEATGKSSLLGTFRARSFDNSDAVCTDEERVEKLQTLMVLSHTVDTKALLTAVRGLASNISYKDFAAHQKVLFMWTGKPCVYFAFTDGDGLFFLDRACVPKNSKKIPWLVGRLRCNPEFVRVKDNRDKYGVAKNKTYYILNANILSTGSPDQILYA